MNSRLPFPAVVAIGGSAGAIEALWSLLAALPSDLPAAVLVVTHIPPYGENNLARVLAKRSSLPVKIAEDGEPLRQGQVYVPRVDEHLMIDGHLVRSTHGPKECRMRPAVNVLFRSVAETCGSRAVGVVLSGTLDDGTAGSWVIKRCGGRVFVQDPEDAMYDSMPRSVLEHVAADGLAPAARLAQLIGDAVRSVSAVPTSVLAGLGVESRLALGESVVEDAVYSLGKPSTYACPECHGVLSQIEEGSIVRFRCHTGHGYSSQTLAADLDKNIEDSLWNAVRALEEKVMLMERVALPSDVLSTNARLQHAHQRLETLKGILLAPQDAAVGEAKAPARLKADA